MAATSSTRVRMMVDFFIRCARSSRPVFIITIAAAANVIMMHPCQLMALHIHTNNI